MFVHDAINFLTRYSVSEGDRVAQLVLERIHTPEISEVDAGQLPFLPEPLIDPFVGAGRNHTW
jgi:hypothetical protein